MTSGTLPPQAVQLRCQNCQTPFTAPVWSYIDVGVEPELKAGLLAGQVNVAVCPQCGFGGMLATPLAYHDPHKKLFLVLMPQEISLKQEDQERFVGEASRVALASIPDDAPKAYVLTPKRFITMQSLLETIMEAEGISKEVLQAQQARISVLSELADAFEADQTNDTHDAETSNLAQVVARHKEALDYEFFLTLGAYIDAAVQQGRQDSAEVLTALRDRVVELSGFDAVEAGLTAPDSATVIEAFLAAEEADLEHVIAEYRPLLDDDFWSGWGDYAAQLEGSAADQAHARRELVQSIVQRMDQEAQALFEAATKLLRTVLEADNPRTVLEEQREQLNEAFMLVIEANVAAAVRAGQQAIAEKLIDIRHQTVDVIEASMTPEERLISQLLNAETAGEATKLLRKNMRVVNQEFVQQVNEMIEHMEKSGQKQTVERLQQVAREAASLLF